TTSSLHTGLPTDRFVAEWWLRSDHVDRVLSGDSDGAPAIVERIAVPRNIYDLRREDPEAAREVQKRIAETCRQAFIQNLAIVGFERTDTDFGYLLAEWQ